MPSKDAVCRVRMANDRRVIGGSGPAMAPTKSSKIDDRPHGSNLVPFREISVKVQVPSRPGRIYILRLSDRDSAMLGTVGRPSPAAEACIEEPLFGHDLSCV